MGKAKPAPPPTARPQTETTQVSHPTVPGHVEHVERTCDTLSTMLRRNQLPRRAYAAGERYRNSYDTLLQAAGGAMDFERARGGSIPGQPPGFAQIEASRAIAQAREKLYARDYLVVHRVCALGHSLGDLDALFDDKREAGRALRRGLRELANLWWPDSGQHQIRSFSDFTATTS